MIPKKCAEHCPLTAGRFRTQRLEFAYECEAALQADCEYVPGPDCPYREIDRLRTRLSDFCREYEVLSAESSRLREALEDRYSQTKCGCGHPACRRCQMDEDTRAALEGGEG